MRGKRRFLSDRPSFSQKAILPDKSQVLQNKSHLFSKERLFLSDKCHLIGALILIRSLDSSCPRNFIMLLCLHCCCLKYFNTKTFLYFRDSLE